MSIHSSSLKVYSVYLAETGQYFYGEDTYDGIVRVGPVWGAFFAVVGLVVITLIVVRMRKRSKREKTMSSIPNV